MSSLYSAARDGNCTNIPEKYRPQNYRTPGFEIHPLKGLFNVGGKLKNSKLKLSAYPWFCEVLKDRTDQRTPRVCTITVLLGEPSYSSTRCCRLAACRTGAGVVELVDALRSGRSGPCARGSSNLPSGTRILQVYAYQRRWDTKARILEPSQVDSPVIWD